jgi:hypothetical protein
VTCHISLPITHFRSSQPMFLACSTSVPQCRMGRCPSGSLLNPSHRPALPTAVVCVPELLDERFSRHDVSLQRQPPNTILSHLQQASCALPVSSEMTPCSWRAEIIRRVSNHLVVLVHIIPSSQAHRTNVRPSHFLLDFGCHCMSEVGFLGGTAPNRADMLALVRRPARQVRRGRPTPLPISTSGLLYQLQKASELHFRSHYL